MLLILSITFLTSFIHSSPLFFFFFFSLLFLSVAGQAKPNQKNKKYINHKIYNY